MHYKVESSISPLVSKTRLFPAGSDCYDCCDHFIILKDVIQPTVQKGREPVIGHCFPKIGCDKTQDLSLGYVVVSREPALNESQNGNFLILIEGQGAGRRLL
jgi:hypothetical protein